MAGNLPTPMKGIISANTANDGTVCRTLAIDNTTLANFLVRVNKMPSGIATIIAKSKANNEI